MHHFSVTITKNRRAHGRGAAETKVDNTLKQIEYGPRNKQPILQNQDPATAESNGQKDDLCEKQIKDKRVSWADLASVDRHWERLKELHQGKEVAGTSHEIQDISIILMKRLCKFVA